MLINQFLIRMTMAHQYSQEAEEIIDKKCKIIKLKIEKEYWD